MKFDPHLSTCTKLNSKWIKALKIRQGTLNQIVETVENMLEITGTEKVFLNMTMPIQALRLTINKIYLMK